MSWLEHHTRSEEYASQAEVFYRQQDINRAVEYYRLAADAESEALKALDPHKTRTLGITVVSATSLYYKAKELVLAKRMAHQWLATEFLPPFATKELEELLQVIYYEESRAESGIQFIDGEVLVSVSGGEILYGAAPLELVLNKVETISKIFYRTTEHLLNFDLRKRGGPSQEIKKLCSPWLLQAVPGSYQFAVRVRKPEEYEQLIIPGLDIGLKVEQITQRFLEIIRATTQDPQGELTEIVPQKDYQKAFMKLTRELAPPETGKSFSQMEIKSTTQIEPRPVILLPESRRIINDALKKPADNSLESSEQKIIQLRGILRGLQLDQDWIEVSLDGETSNQKIYEANEEIDDFIGQMVNRRVVVEVVEKANQKYAYHDIQLEENVQNTATS